MSFTLGVEIDDEKIRCVLCSAFEGGSNYWYLIDKRILPPGRKSEDYQEGGAAQVGKFYWHWAELVPLEEGGALIISSKEGDEIDGKKKWRLDRDAIKRGLEAMSTREDCRYQWGRFLGEDGGDADTGDVFLQCCLFGKVVYG